MITTLGQFTRNDAAGRRYAVFSSASIPDWDVHAQSLVGDGRRYAMIVGGRVVLATPDPTAIVPDYVDDNGDPAPVTIIATDEAVAAGMVFDGTSLSPAPPEPDPVPQTVTMAQAREAMRRAGILAQVPAVLQAIEDDDQRETALIAWDHAPYVARTGAFVTSLAPAFGLDDGELDGLFRVAASVTF